MKSFSKSELEKVIQEETELWELYQHIQRMYSTINLDDTLSHEFQILSSLDEVFWIYFKRHYHLFGDNE